MTHFYVYRVSDVRFNRHYYGSRQCETDPNDDIGVKYFTSSLIVQRETRSRPMDFRYKVVFRCETRKDSYRLERKIQLKLDVSNSENFYNEAICGELYNRFKGDRKMSPENRKKVSRVMNEKMAAMSKEEKSRKFGSFGATNPMIRDGGHSSESKVKMSEAQRRVAERLGSDYYKRMSELSKTPEARAKQRKSTERLFNVVYKTGVTIQYTHQGDLGIYLGLSSQMGPRIIQNPHLWAKYNISNIIFGDKE